MTHGSLFNGIGGFQLAAHWMGWDNVFSCEIDEWCNKVTKYHFPNCIQHGDIKTTDFTIYRGGIDILTGGFPCQPYSVAGKRKGKDDERHLWPEMLRSIREIKPRWIVGENVRGLISWDGGLVFDEVQADLEAIGYEVLPFLLPACAVNAPHRRDRIWFIAHANDQRRSTGLGEIQETYGEIPEWNDSAEFSNSGSGVTTNTGSQRSERAEFSQQPETCQQKQGELGGSNSKGTTTNTNTNTDSDKRCERRMHQERCEKAERYTCTCDTRYSRTDWQNFPTQSPVLYGDDGISCRLDGITFSKWRNNSIKGAGNAIVPQVAYQIFKAIAQYEQIINDKTK